MPEGSGWTEIAHRNALRLLRLVNSLLDFSRIEAGRVEVTYRPTDLAALTAELAFVVPLAIEKRMRFVSKRRAHQARLCRSRHVGKDSYQSASNAFKFTLAGEIRRAPGGRGGRD